MKVEYEVRTADGDRRTFAKDGEARAYALQVVRDRPGLDFVTMIAWVDGKPGQRWIIRRTCERCGRIIGKDKCTACEGGAT
jgi:hypothetical protein